MIQIGIRWGAGSVPHPSVPQLLFSEIAKAEQLHPAASSWTLTWLESLPVCTLDDLCQVRLTAVGAVEYSLFSVDSDDSDDDSWLS